MLRLTIPEGIDRPVPVYQGRSLEAGKTYLCSNRFVGQLLLSRWRVKIGSRHYPIRTLLKVANWSGIKPFLLSNADWNDRDLWLCRGGGYGDLLAMTPLIRYINQSWPRCRLHVSCGTMFHDLFFGLDVIPEMIPVPFDPTMMLVDFEELVEGDPNAEKFHIIDLFAKRAGVELNNRDIFYRVSDQEFEDAFRNYPRTEKKRIAIQFMASALYRSYPKMNVIIKELAEKYEIFIFGTPGQVEFDAHPNITNLMEKKLSFRRSAAALLTCDLCIAPDSALVHLCSALNIRCIALYGPIPSILRVGESKIHPIDGTAPCAPCFFHADRSTDFPVGMPCTKIGKCVALDDIPVEQVLGMVKKFIPGRI